MSHASKDMTEGYLTLAVGRENYLRMCINLAISIKINDPKRRTCLAVGKSLLNEAILTEIDSVFDDRIEIEETNLEGVEYKMNSYKYSPYTRTMFVDGDVLLAKKDIDAIWDKLRGSPFSFVGKKTTSGFWRVNIDNIISTLGIEFVAEGNCGVYYFEKSEMSQKVFISMRELFSNHKEIITTIHHGKGYSIEPIFGSACGIHNIEPFPQKTRKGLQWHFTTIKGSDFNLDVRRGVCSFLKGGVEVSPTFIHFPGLNLSGKSHVDHVYAKAVADMIGRDTVPDISDRVEPKL
ncbi:hypothetical protein [Methylorubrum salsuginis]|uniref:Glycosyl transferase family 8 n=1 Tax=Methylorubrum salsuginis TaxID=414703 RepID=A0A1I4ECQ1_9HYPH|nr:hypothetical protein [Methylorubrum salsuginis]SFL03043.1 hypothetical protein SAMN04488125_107199 [Methylorubrum salsuginis]